MFNKIKKSLITALKFGFALILMLVSYRVLFVEPVYWSGVYYPQGNMTGNAIYSPRFTSKEECIGWAINERGFHPEDKDVSLGNLWECNKNCRLSPDYGTLINSTQKFKQELLDENMGPLYVCDDGGFDGADWLRGDF